MRKPLSRIFAVLALVVASLFPAGCDNGGTELPNELRGSVVQGGHPAANVKVGLYAINYIPADSGSANQAWTTKTDANGDYEFRQIPPGRYNLVGVKDSLGFFRDSVSVSGAADVGRDSLGSLGDLSGIVRLQPQDEPRNAIVQVMGTDIYVNVDTSGGFTVTGLAAGVYRLRVFVALPNYVPLFKVVEIHPGRHEVLSEPLEPFYSGLPVVTDVRVSLDTATGVAKITWHPVAYHSLLTYLVYRDELNAVSLSATPLNLSRIQDTVYYDTLYRNGGVRRDSVFRDGALRDSAYFDTTSHDWEYRVRVKANNSDIGDAIQPARLHAVPPGVIATLISINRVGGGLDAVFRGDTLRLVAGISNVTVENRKLVWLHGADTLRQVAVAGKSAQDSLTWIAPITLGPDTLRVAVTDANGKVWTRAAALRIVASRFVGETKRPAASIEAYAWNGKVVHVARDSTGFVSIGIFDPAARKDSLLASLVRMSDTGAFAFSGSHLYCLGAAHPGFPGANVVAYDLAAGAWAKEPNLPTDLPVMTAVAAGGRLYMLARSAKWDTLDVYALDLSAHLWSARNSRLSNHVMNLSEVEGTVYLASSLDGPYSTSWEKYDTLADTWTAFPMSDRMKHSLYTRLAGSNGALYSLGGWTYDMSLPSNQENISPSVDRFDAAKNAWTAAPELLLGRSRPGVAAIGSSLYVIGGMAKDGLTATIEEYRPE